MGNDSRADVGQINAVAGLLPPYFVGGHAASTRLTQVSALATQWTLQATVVGFDAASIGPFTLWNVLAVDGESPRLVQKVERGFGTASGKRSVVYLRGG